GLHPGYEHFPHPGIPEGPHGAPGAVPTVEIADHLHRAGIGGPHRERGSLHLLPASRPAQFPQMRAEYRPEVLVPPLADEVEVDLAQGGEDLVRSAAAGAAAVLVAGLDLVAGNILAGDLRGPDPAVFVRSGDLLAADVEGHALGEVAHGS